MAESKSAALPLGYAPTGSFRNGGRLPAESVPATPVYRERCGISTRLRQPPSSEGGLRRVKRLRRGAAGPAMTEDAMKPALPLPKPAGFGAVVVYAAAMPPIETQAVS